MYPQVKSVKQDSETLGIVRSIVRLLESIESDIVAMDFVALKEMREYEEFITSYTNKEMLALQEESESL